MVYMTGISLRPISYDVMYKLSKQCTKSFIQLLNWTAEDTTHWLLPSSFCSWSSSSSFNSPSALLCTFHIHALWWHAGHRNWCFIVHIYLHSLRRNHHNSVVLHRWSCRTRSVAGLSTTKPIWRPLGSEIDLCLYHNVSGGAKNRHFSHTAQALGVNE